MDYRKYINGICRWTLAASLLAVLFACGDDSSSVMEAPSKKTESSSSESSSSWADGEIKDSSAIGEIIESGMGTTNVVHGEFYDPVKHITYGTVQVGAYVWMTENVSYEAENSVSTCYDKSVLKCDSYGRLYERFKAVDVCPEGFFLPRKVDYEYLMSFAGNLYTSSVGFDLKMSGFCQDSGNDIACSGLGKAAYLLTSENGVVQISRGGKAQFVKQEPYGYYSVRCAKFSRFVDTQKFLPQCDSSSKSRLGKHYVAEEGSNFYCDGKAWVKSNDKKCDDSDKGSKHYYNDSLLICDGTWQLAAMDQDIDECFELNQWSDRRLNGVRYVCDNAEWRKTSDIEDAIGFCYPEKIGIIDSVLEKNSFKPYYCDTTGWRAATFKDAFGPCDSTKLYDLVSFHGDKRTCRADGSWGVLTFGELDRGICTPKRQGEVVSTEESSFYYVCDTLEWRRATFEEAHGNCTEERFNDIVAYEGSRYACRKDLRWSKFTSAEMELGLCDSKRVGEMDTLTTDYNIYLCDTSGWRSASISELYGSCDNDRLYKVVEYGSYKYGCSSSLSWTRIDGLTYELGFCTKDLAGTRKVSTAGVEYICDSTWRTLTKNDVLGFCTEKLEGTILAYNFTNYACVNGNWRTLNAYEDKIGVCSSANEGDVKKIDYRPYLCSKGAWTYYTIIDAYDSCTTERAGETVKFNGEDFICHSKRWQYFSDLEKQLGVCNPTRNGEISPEIDGDYYQCKKTLWVSVGIAGVLGSCSSTNKFTEEKVGDKSYFCAGKNWYPMTALEKNQGLCTDERVGETVVYGDHKYGCSYDSYAHSSEYYWSKYNRIDSLGGFCDGTTLKWIRVDGIDYACTDSYRFWRIDKDFFRMWPSCRSEYYGKIVGYEGREFYCGSGVTSQSSDYYDWHLMTAVDSTDAGVCDKTRYKETMTFEGEKYMCTYPAKNSYSVEWTLIKDE